jgi:hypothetical protein
MSGDEMKGRTERGAIVDLGYIYPSSRQRINSRRNKKRTSQNLPFYSKKEKKKRKKESRGENEKQKETDELTLQNPPPKTSSHSSLPFSPKHLNP